jgi:predicted RNA-binding Zn-ribbon protein involved in translation (DUF1610 family)
MEREISLFHQGGSPHHGATPFTCPRCGHYSQQFPALSRADNKTEICSACGTDEALFCMVHTRKEFLEHSLQWMKEAKIKTTKIEKLLREMKQ